MSYKNTLVLEELRKQSEKVYFRSSFCFLNAHRSWRPSRSHLLIAPPGAGKTTLLRTLIADVASNVGKKIAVYLSEETVEDFWTEISYSNMPQELIDSVYPISESDLTDKTARGIFLALSEHVDSVGADIIFIDNVTTMKCYGESFKNQSYVTECIKALAIKKRLPVLTVAHTGAQIKESYQGLIDMNDIRGSKDIVNQSEFLYILQPLYIGNTRKTFISIKKHRGQPVKNNLFQLFYFESVKLFAKDEPRNFEEFKEIFKERNKL